MSTSSRAVDPSFYDEAYFENGPMFGKSLYSYYRWMPEPTFRMAMAIIEYTDLKRGEPVLDFGCAKGYLVKALRCLFRDAYGCDCSEYAIARADEEARPYLALSTPEKPLPTERHFHLVVAKDVLEHLPKDELGDTLSRIRSKCDEFLVVVPLGANGKFLIEQYELDLSHQIREDKKWWLGAIERAGFSVRSAEWHIPGIKDSWFKVHPKGNLLVLAE